MIESLKQVNYMQDGRLLLGAYPDPAIQSAIEGRTTLAEDSKESFRNVVDQENLNDKYAPEIAVINDYYRAKGLSISPLRVVKSEVMDRAYAASGERPEPVAESAQGRNINDRAVVIEDRAIIDAFGPEYILAIGLHEGAHSLSGSGNRLLRTVRQNDRRIALGGYATSGLIKADLKENSGTSLVGDFWEEAFADFTRVKALRELNRTNDLTESKTIEIGDGSVITVNPNSMPGNVALGDSSTIMMPAEYATLTKVSESGRNKVGTAPSNFAAYALGLLDARLPGLYEDFVEAATHDPKRQADAIRKIESLQPGLYRQLRDLEYTEEGFAEGLRVVIDVLNSAPTLK